jgi:hypothetical protein
MNVLLLSPDAVGGTLLERLITVYMQFHEYDRPVLNTTHPEGGVGTYFSPEFNQEILSKRGMPYGFYQNLDEVVELYRNAQHYVVTKLTYHSMKERHDPPNQTVPFYRFFNENYFVIACRRENVFENALSWGITKISKARNVYSHHEKIYSFLNYYRDGVSIDPESLIDSLEQYKNYLKWVDDNFAPSSYYYYERHVFDIEKYILSLPIFSGQPEKKTWKDIYGIEFNNWNRCHFLASDIGSIAMNNPAGFPQIANDIRNSKPLEQTASLNWTMPMVFLESYKHVADPSWPEVNTVKDFETLPQHIQQECIDVHKIDQQLVHSKMHRNLASNLDAEHHRFLAEHSGNYLKAMKSMERMRELDIAIGMPPIKKQTLAEKRHIIKNFDQCAEVYNTWIEQNPSIAKPVTIESLSALSTNEQTFWHRRGQRNPELPS